MNIAIDIGSDGVAVGKTTILCLVANMLKKYGFKVVVESDTEKHVIENLMDNDAFLAGNYLKEVVTKHDPKITLTEIVGNGYKK